MKIQYASDLHLEFPENRRFLMRNPLKPVGDILVLAGDIIPFALLESLDDFIDILADRFNTVYWLPGNHEFYYFDIDKKPSPLFEKIRRNVYLVNDQVVELGDVKLIFSILWSKISPENQCSIKERIPDFSVIKSGIESISMSQYSLFHESSLSFVESAVRATPDSKKMIVTHYVPTLVNYPQDYRATYPLIDAFATELGDLIELSEASYWLYGHNHNDNPYNNNIPDFKIGNTTLITNQLGYVSKSQHLAFRNDASVEING